MAAFIAVLGILSILAQVLLFIYIYIWYQSFYFTSIKHDGVLFFGCFFFYWLIYFLSQNAVFVNFIDWLLDHVAPLWLVYFDRISFSLIYAFILMQHCLTILTISYSLYFVDLCSRTQVFQHYFHVPEHNPSAVSFCCRCPPNYSFPHKKIPHLGVGGICCGNDDFTPETQVEIIDGLGIKSHLVRVVKTSFLGSLTLFFFLVCWLTWWLCGPTLSVQFAPYITFKAVPSRKTWGSVM